jgi:hypothetical protein
LQDKDGIFKDRCPDGHVIAPDSTRVAHIVRTTSIEASEQKMSCTFTNKATGQEVCGALLLGGRVLGRTVGLQQGCVGRVVGRLWCA